MPVYSHSKEVNGKRVGSKELIVHLQGVHDKALLHFSKRTSFEKNYLIKESLSVICWLHDLGKYTSYFQAYLLEPKNADFKLKAHSSLGAHTAFSFLKSEPEMALLAFYIIKMHHSNLMNIDSVLFPENSQSRMQEPEIFNKQLASLIDLKEIKSHFTELKEQHIAYSTHKELFGQYKKYLKKEGAIELYFKTTYLFSLLIEADKLDASDTDIYEAKSLPANAVDIRFGKPVFTNVGLSSMSQNDLRNYVRSEVVKNLERDDILEKHIFTLAAPTGIGKTMTSLDFVLKLRHKIEEQSGFLPQIIYGLPFINIIEQSLNEYEKTLDSGKVIGHYQYADIFGLDEKEKNEISDEERCYSQTQMSWDTWQSDVVITSFVQLFETLIGNRNKLLKKFRHFADSIIIIDEVQTLSIEKLPVIGAALYYFCCYLNTRVLIMTATQPKIFKLMERELDIKMDKCKPFNLLLNDNEVFQCFNRTKIVPLVEQQIDNDDFIKIFNTYWHPHKSCVVVVNKVSRSIEIFNLLKEFLFQHNNVELFYLSTNITPIERQNRVNKIKELLPTKICVLVSTQVVEAGVDLDFDLGFRDIGPIDSIVQVAGRINRENSDERKGAPLYIVDFGDCVKIYGFATDIKARNSLNKEEIEERDYKSMVEAYFQDVSDQKITDFKYSKDIFNAMINLKYAFPASSTKKHITVSDFKIIEESHHAVSIFIESIDDSKGTKSREAYQLLLEGKMAKSEFDKNHKKSFNQRMIAVPNYFDKVKELEMEDKLSENILWVKPEEFQYYYDESTGFRRESSNMSSTTMI